MEDARHMIITKRKFFLTHVRIILDDEELKKYFREKRYSYITGLSYKQFDFGAGVAVKHKKTILISLGDTPEKILGGFHPSTRHEVRRALGDADLTIRSDDLNTDAIYQLYASFERAQGRIPHGRSIFLGSKVFGAYRDGELISAIICYDAKPILRSRANFSKRLMVSDNKDRRAVSGATKRLIYEICLYGRAHGYLYFDQGSVNLTDQKKKSIGEFKSSFGGELVDEYTYTYRGRILQFLGL